MEPSIALPPEDIKERDPRLGFEIRVLEDHLEDNTLLVALVPNLVLVGVVEKEHLAAPPRARLVPHSKE
jgi:hypothetical protein